MTEVGPGSMIKRTDTVQIVTAADLQQSGYTTRAP